MERLKRRNVVLGGLRLLSAAVALPLAAPRARAAGTCVEPASQGLRDSLHYKFPTPLPEQPCKACAFFTAADKSACGTCMIMSGPVNSGGHCDSWAARS